MKHGRQIGFPGVFAALVLPCVLTVCPVRGEGPDEIALDRLVEQEFEKLKSALKEGAPAAPASSNRNEVAAVVGVPATASDRSLGEAPAAADAFRRSDRSATDPAELASLRLQLASAEQEILRLKNVVQRILEANRRERRNMHYNMACVYRVGRLWRLAEKEFILALDMDPDDAAAHYNLAILYDEDLKDPRKARRHFERFLELAPEDRDAFKVREWLAGMR